MKKVLLTFLLITVILISICFSASATFTSEMPDYVNYSGGAWFEIYDSVVGRCTVIFPLEFKDNIFGFSLSDTGLPSDIVNFSNSTIYGLVITSNGLEYSCRCSRFSTIEVQTSTSSYSNYVTLNPDVVSLANSNMLFITDDTNYINDTVPDYGKFEIVMLAFIALCSFFSLCTNLLRRGRR